MSKGINARAWFYGQSFHSTRDFQDAALRPDNAQATIDARLRKRWAEEDAARERARARGEAIREALELVREDS